MPIHAAIVLLSIWSIINQGVITVQGFRRHEKQKKTLCIMHYKDIHKVHYNALFIFYN